MANSLKYTDSGYLLICRNALSLSCCGTSQSIFWDMVPCDIDIRQRTTCSETDQCQFIDRLYVSPSSQCQGTEIKICESQRIHINNISYIATGVLNNVLSISYGGGALDLGQIEWYDNQILVTDPLNGFVTIDNTGTIQMVVNALDALPDWTATNGSTNLDFTLPGQVIAEIDTSFLGPGTQLFPSRPSSFTLRWGTGETPIIPFTTGYRQLCTGIIGALNQIPGLSGNITGIWNQNYGLGNNKAYFDILFSGLTTCGTPQPRITYGKEYLLYETAYNGRAISGLYGTYSRGNWLNENVYTRFGSGSVPDVADFGVRCPYNATVINNGGEAYGPYPYDGSQCCPQLGTTIGPTQQLFPTTDSTSGYKLEQTSGTFSNLDNVVLLNNECYSIDPFFFLFGKEGRFIDSKTTTRTAYKIGDCDYTKHPLSGGCVSQLPTNCAMELFLAMFHKNVPWGPFGAYCNNIEVLQHPTTDTVKYPGAYIYDNYGIRYGWDYRPIGNIKTMGEWTETTGIKVTFSYRKPVPFYVGGSAGDDLIYGKIDEATATSFEINSNDGCGSIILTYNCSGKTVGDFVSAINSLRTPPPTGQIDGCPIFSFCLSASNVGGTPLSRIVNVSTEMFDIADYFDTYEGFGAGDPTSDANKYSGSDIFVSPKRYSEMWPRRTTIDNVSNYIRIYNNHPNGPTSPDNPTYKLPPFCRHIVAQAPSKNYATFPDYRRNNGAVGTYWNRSPWWRSIEGEIQTSVVVELGSGIPSYITQVNVGVVNKNINLTVVSGSTTIFTTSINTGSGLDYTTINCARELTDIGFIDANSILFWPVKATGGLQDFTVWLNDLTFWDEITFLPAHSGDIGAIRTPYNWSYREPLRDITTQNLRSTSPLNLKSFIRRRCDIGSDPELSEYPPLTGCVPQDATTYDSSTRLDCNGDRVYDGDILVAYGCTSYVCKTEWYVKTSRCSCSDEWNCASKSFVAHAYNQEGNSTSNQALHETYAVTQPTLYICEHNFHPECDIPMLVKVPFQIFGNKTDFGTNPDGLGYECGQSSIAIVYGDGTHPDTEEQYLGTVRCDEWDIYDSSENVFKSECAGWCQYLDPISAERVRKEDIPTTWPPTAYVANRGSPVFCSINPYSEPIEEICNPSAGPTYGWDSIYNVIPHVPAEYYKNYEFTPCMMDSYGGGLRVITRPIINPLTIGELCGIENDTRIDINCATKCCGCEFRCDSGTGDYTAGPFRAPCYQTWDYDETYSVENETIVCSVANNFGFCGDINTYRHYGGLYDLGYTVSFSYNYNTTCGCFNDDFGSPAIVWTYTRGAVDCNSVGGTDFAYYDPCLGPLPPGYSTYCDGGIDICAAPSTQVLGCEDLENLFQTRSSGIINEAGILARETYANSDFEFSQEVFLEIDNCGNPSQTWYRMYSTIYEGTSPYDSQALGLPAYPTTFENTRTETTNGSYSIGVETCSACPEGSMTAKTLPHITGWLTTLKYHCDYPNLLINYYPARFPTEVC